MVGAAKELLAVLQELSVLMGITTISCVTKRLAR